MTSDFHLSDGCTLGPLKVYSVWPPLFKRLKDNFVPVAFSFIFFSSCWYNMVMLLSRLPLPTPLIVTNSQCSQAITASHHLRVPVQEANPSYLLKGLIPLHMDH